MSVSVCKCVFVCLDITWWNNHHQRPCQYCPWHARCSRGQAWHSCGTVSRWQADHRDCISQTGRSHSSQDHDGSAEGSRWYTRRSVHCDDDKTWHTRQHCSLRTRHISSRTCHQYVLHVLCIIHSRRWRHTLGKHRCIAPE